MSDNAARLKLGPEAIKKLNAEGFVFPFQKEFDVGTDVDGLRAYFVTKSLPPAFQETLRRLEEKFNQRSGLQKAIDTLACAVAMGVALGPKELSVERASVPGYDQAEISVFKVSL